MEKINEIFIEVMPTVLMFIAVIVIGLVASKLIIRLLKNILTKTNIDHTAVTFVLSFVKVLLYIIIAITALATIGVNAVSYTHLTLPTILLV